MNQYASEMVGFMGERFRGFFLYLQGVFVLAKFFFEEAFKRPVGFKDIRLQLEEVGLASLPIAIITLLFVGLVFAFQFGVTLRAFGGLPYVGKTSTLSIVRELGPVFTALVVGGRVGAGMAAELGSMKVTEQIDAIRAIGASPYKKLLVPRMIAATFMIPIVTILSSAAGMLGAMLVSWLEFNVTPIAFYQSSIVTVTIGDIISGFLKPFVFGFGIALIGCYHGFECETGTAGVGKATTQAVVNVSLMIVFTDFLMTRLFAAVF